MDQPHALTGGNKWKEGDLQVGGIGMGYVSVFCFLVLGRVKLINFYFYVCVYMILKNMKRV